MSFDAACSHALYPSNVEDVSARAKAICYTCAALQSLLFLVSAAMLTRNLKHRISRWKLFNSLCSLFCAGSLLEIAAWMCYPLFIGNQMRFFSDPSVFIDGIAYKSQAGVDFASSGVYFASIFICLSGLGFCFYSCGKLLVLERVIKFSHPGLLHRLPVSSIPIDGHMSKTRILITRIVAAVALICLIIGWLCVAIGSFGYLTAVLEASRARAQQRDAWVYASTDIVLFKSLYKDGGLRYNAAFQKALVNEAIQSWSSFVVLSFISCAFTICTLSASSRFLSLQRQTGRLDRDSETLLKSLRSQVFVTTSSVFLTFLLRSVYAGTFAIAKEAPLNGSCPHLCDSSSDCQSSNFVLGQYLLYDPLPLSLVTMISEPFTSFLVIWGMSQGKPRPSNDSSTHSLNTVPGSST